MAVVISQVEHRPSADRGEDGSTDSAATVQVQPVGPDQVLAIMRRERARQERLWAD